MHGVSGMNDDELLDGRPYGGCLIIWNQSIKATVEPIQCNSNRLCAVKICIENMNMILFNLYMPVNDIDTYNTVLYDINSIYESQDAQYVLIGGGFDTSFKRCSSPNTISLLDFINDKDFTCCLYMDVSDDIDYTYESKIDGTRSTIDHFMVSESLKHLVKSYNVSHDGHNFSDHSLLGISINVSVTYQQDFISEHSKLMWNTASEDDIKCYQELLDTYLKTISIPLNALTLNGTDRKTHTSAHYGS